MDLQELKNKIQESRKLIEENAESVIKSVFKQMFDENPELLCIRFVAYIPRFNDGEPCEYSVHSPDYITSENFTDEGIKDILEEAKSGQGYSFWSEFDGWNSKYNKYWNELHGLGNDIFQVVFGTDVEVIVLRDQLIINDYDDHD